MASKQNRIKQQKSAAATNWEWLALLIFTVFMLMWPFQYGFFNGAGLHTDNQLYFEDKVYYGIMLGIPALILIIGKFISNANWEKKHFIALIGLAFPALYLINYYSAESVYLNRISLHNTIFIYSFFVLGIFVSGNSNILRKIIHLYFGIGSAVVIYSFTYLFGNKFRLDALAFSDGVRLTSVFTYANGYAAFLLTLLLVGVYQLTGENRRLIQLIYGSMLVPIAASLMLTLSRSAMLMLPIIAIVALLLVNMRRQLLVLIYVGLAFIVSLTIQSSLSGKGLAVYNQTQASIASNQPISTINFFAQSSITGWAALIAATLVMLGLVYLIAKYNKKIKVEKWTTKYSQLALPLVLVLLSVAVFAILKSGLLNPILPEQISDRIDNFTLNTHSVLERFTFYRDSLSIWKENIWIGGGGKTWEALYDRYQSYPYVSSQPHSYFIDLLLDTGIVGFLLVVGGLVYIIVTFVRQYLKQKISDRENYLLYLLIPLSVLLHSLIDFEMSYSFFAVSVFFCIGVLAGQQKEGIWTKAKPAYHKRASYVLAATWGVLAIMLLIGTTNAFSAHAHYTNGIRMMQEQRPFDQLNDELVNGLERVSGHPNILYRLATNYVDAFKQTNDKQYLNPAEKYTRQLQEAEPHSSWAIRARYNLAITTQNLEEANLVMKDAIENFPYEMSYYEQAIKGHYQQWLSDVESDNKVGQQEQSAAIQEIVDLHAERALELTKISEKIGYIRTFTWSEEINSIVNQIKI